MHPVYQVPMLGTGEERDRKAPFLPWGEAQGQGLNISNYVGVQRPSVTACMERHGGRGSGKSRVTGGAGRVSTRSWPGSRRPWTRDVLKTCLLVSAHLDLLFCPLLFLRFCLFSNMFSVFLSMHKCSLILLALKLFSPICLSAVYQKYQKVLNF